MSKRKNAFTLVELLAVIVILAIILVIAVPKVISIIDDTKKGTLESTAKMIASAAEKAKVQNAILGKDIEITCDSVVKLNNVDYERCNIEFIDNKAYVDIKGSGKFENMYVCKGTKDEAHIVNRCPNEKVMVELQPNTEEEYNNISGIYKEGDVIYLDTPTKTGFLFVRWEVVSGDSVIENDNKLTVGEFDTIVYAVWENNPSFEVVLDGGVDNIDYKERYQTRTIIDLEVPTKTNYKFIRWEKVSGDGVLSGNTYTMGTEDTVIKAIWELNVFSLTIEPNGGTITQEFKSEYAVGEIITLETPTRTGYIFTGWTASSGTLNGNVFTMGTSDVTLTANWEISTYNITYELDGGTNASGNPTSGMYGSTVIVSNPTKTNHTFKGWSVSGVGSKINGTNLIIGHENITLTAIWDEYSTVALPNQSGILTYNGNSQSPNWNNFDDSVMTISGTTSGLNSGSYSAIFTPKEGYMWEDKTTASKTVSWSIEKASSSLVLSASSGTITGKKNTASFTVNKIGDGEILVKSSNTGVATVSVSGTTVTVTSSGYGSSTITVSVAEGTNYTASSNRTYAVTVDYRYLYNSGTEYTSFTGELTSEARILDDYASGRTRAPSINKNTSSVTITQTYSSSGYGANAGWVYWTNPIDLTNYTTLRFSGSWGGKGGHTGVGIWNSKSGSIEGSSRVAYINDPATGVNTLDISKLNGKYYIGFYVYNANNYITCNYLRLE